MLNNDENCDIIKYSILIRNILLLQWSTMLEFCHLCWQCTELHAPSSFRLNELLIVLYTWNFLLIFGKAPSINKRTLIILGMADAYKFNLIQFWVTVKLVSIYFNAILSVIRSSSSLREHVTLYSINVNSKIRAWWITVIIAYSL